MNFKKLKPILKPYRGCLNCDCGEMQKIENKIVAELNTVLYNSFGGWRITKDNKVIYQGPSDLEFYEYPKLIDFELKAQKDPDHDYRAICNLPLRYAEYQRQEKNQWVLIKTGEGFV